MGKAREQKLSEQIKRMRDRDKQAKLNGARDRHFAAMKSAGLEVPDLQRCQAEFTEYHPFIMGGNVYQKKRCTNTAVWLAYEPQQSGQIQDCIQGCMSVCSKCRIECKKKVLGATFIKI